MSEFGSGQRREWVLSVLREHEARLVRYATRLLGDEDAARDVVQHAFLRLCDQSPEELEGREAQWLFTVCRNRAVDAIRARRRRVALDRKVARPNQSKEPDPALSAERRDLYARLNELVAALPAAQRDTIDLWTEGFSYGEISEITGHGQGRLRVLVHRALKRLRSDPVVRQMLDVSGPIDGPLPPERSLPAGQTGLLKPIGKVRT
jgi:RNA polymerase sigma-70 factor (ECF subfamily)